MHASKMRVRGGYCPGLELLEGRWQPGSILSTDLAWSLSLPGLIDLALGDSRVTAPLEVAPETSTAVIGNSAPAVANPVAPVAAPLEVPPVAVASAPAGEIDLVRLAGVTPVELEGGVSINGCPVDFSEGFPSPPPGLTLNENASIVDGTLRLTPPIKGQRGSAFFNTRVGVQAFFAFFSIRMHGGGHADGMGFAIHNDPAGVSAIGGGGGFMGYQGILDSVFIKFDTWDNRGEGRNSTGLFSGGREPTTPRAGGDVLVGLDDTGVDMKSEHLLFAQMLYDGSILDVTIIDGETGATARQVYLVDIPAKVNGTTAFVGFTGATGGVTDNHDVNNWLYCDF